MKFKDAIYLRIFIYVTKKQYLRYFDFIFFLKFFFNPKIQPIIS